MEKEINIEENEFNINFFYDEFDLSNDEVLKYKQSLQLMGQSFSHFKNTTLVLENFTLNLNISICSDLKIMELNSEYRNKNKITDVLSFPLQENIRTGEYDKFCPELELGDLYICHNVCLEQAKEFSLTFQEEFIHLATHGYLHLCGFDHEISIEEEKKMEQLEELIINKISQLKNKS